jgi:hypothetical protein
VTPMTTVLTALAPITLSSLLLAAPLAQADPAAETLAEHQQRVALELEAENLLVKLHQARLDAELEPCINGGVSPSGRFANNEIEEAVERLAGGGLTEPATTGAYYRALNEGRIALRD